MRIVWLLMALLLMGGCSPANRELDKAMEFRAELLGAAGCSFSAEVTADYGDRLSLFSMDCQGDAQGNLSFVITKPETLAGIRGTVSDRGGELTFADTALYFDLLTDEQLTPASAPWILVHTLRSGYITSAGEEGKRLRLSIDDSYTEDALHLDIWMEDDLLPAQADILYDGKRILSMTVENFRLL